MAITVRSHPPAIWTPVKARRSSLCACTVATGMTPSTSRQMSGLKTTTASHMLRSVLGNTPSSCSSMKLHELSNPLMPRRAAAKPKNTAVPRLTSVGACQFAMSMEGSRTRRTTPIRQKATRVSRWSAKMPTATADDSVIPMMERTANRPRRATVAPSTGSPGTRFCA